MCHQHQIAWLGVSMDRFIEQNADEAGFATIWDDMVAPDLANYQSAFASERRRAYLLAVVLVIGCGALAGLVEGLQQAGMLSENQSQIGFIAVFILGSVAYSWCFRRLKALKADIGGQLKAALDRFFQDRFSVLEADDALLAETDSLQSQKLLARGERHLGVAYTGQFQGCDFTFYNCTIRQKNRQNTSDNVIPYLILNLELAEPISDLVLILPDAGVMNRLNALFKKAKTVRFDNAEFEKRFEVYSYNSQLARAIITPEFQTSFIEMQRYFMPKTSILSTQKQLTCRLDGKQMTICYMGLDDIAGTDMAASKPAAFVEAAHNAIARMSQIPKIIDNLQSAIPQIASAKKRP